MTRTLGEHEIAAVLDTEHAEIHARLSFFRDRTIEGAPSDELRKMLDALHDMIVSHFRTEETAMQRLRYGGLWDHRDEHLVIWRAFIHVTDVCHTVGFTPDCGARIYATVSNMLTRHTERFDAPLVEYARTRLDSKRRGVRR